MPAPALHSSLRARTNLVLAGVWLTALVGDVFFLGGVPWTMVGLGLASGVLQGVLQRRALRDGSAQLLMARSALEVRAALVGTAAGRAQIKVLWGSGAAYVAVAIISGGGASPVRVAPIVVSALLTQWFVREAMTVGACVELEKGPPAAAT